MRLQRSLFSPPFGALALWAFAVSTLSAQPLPQSRVERVQGSEPRAEAPVTAMERDLSRARERFQRGMAAVDEGEFNAALEFFEDVVEDHPTSPLAAEAHLQRGLIFSERHQFEKAQAEFVSILSRYPEYGNFNRVIDELFGMGQRILEGERPRYFGVIPGFKNHQVGVDIFLSIVRFAPFSDFAPQSLMDAAALYERMNEPEMAIDALDRLVNRYPQSVLSEEAYLELAQLHRDFVQGPDYDQAATREAIRYYEDFLILYPRSASASDAEEGLETMRNTLARNKFLLGEFYWFYRNLDEAALVFLNESITIAPDSPTAAEAEALIARIESGEEPPKTPADVVFGRYQHPRQFILERPDDSENDANGDNDAGN